MTSTRICSVEVCDLPYYSTGYCRSHYARFRRDGDAGSTAIRTGPAPVAERFAKYCGPEGLGCRIWTGAIIECGYGLFGAEKRKMVYAHRFAYEAELGAIPAGLQIDHICCNRACVAVHHMQLVTPRQNCILRDIRNGRNVSPESWAEFFHAGLILAA